MNSKESQPRISRRGFIKAGSAAIGAAVAEKVVGTQAAECEFVLGFKTLRDLINEAEGRDVVGKCLEDERYNPINGDSLQRTSGGLMVWRKHDNWTAFTDGWWTWLNGPNGLEKRLNTEQFDWERAHEEQLEAARQVLDEYVAGGEFMDPNQGLGRFTQDGEKARFSDSQNRFVFEDDKSHDGVKVTQVTSDGRRTNIEFDLPTGFYVPQVRWYPNLGIVGTDGYRITHQYDAGTGEWQELEEFIPLGTAHERMSKSLRDFVYEDYVEIDGQRIHNPLGLDPEEVELFIRTGDDRGLKSFQILRNSKGEPAIIVVTGGKHGISKDSGNVERIKQAVSRLNEIDKNVVDLLVNQFGLRAIAGDIPPRSELLYTGNRGTFDTKRGVIELPETGYSVPSLISTILEESRGIYHRQISSDRVNDGIDKSSWTKQWTLEHEPVLLPEEFQRMINNAETSLQWYSNILENSG